MRGSVFSYETKAGKRWGFVHDVPGQIARRPVKKRGFRLRRDADEALAASLDRLRAGVPVAPHEQTVSQALGGYLLDRRGDVAPNTYGTWVWAQRHIDRSLGAVRVADLQPEHLDGFLRQLRTDGLGQGSQRKAAQVLKLVLARLIERGHLSPRIYAGVRWPKRPKLSHVVLTQAEIDFVLERTRGTRYEIPFLVAVTTGLRRNELLSLTAQDYSRKSLTVRAETSKGKTRIVPLRPGVSEALAALVDENQIARARRPTWNREGFLFADPISGFRYAANAWTVAWTGWQQRNLSDMRRVSWHALRHTAATHWLQAGVPLPKVSQWLGHSSPAITAAIYIHAIQGDDDELVTRLEERCPITSPDKGAVLPFSRRGRHHVSE